MNCLYRCHTTAIVEAIRSVAVGRLKMEGRENAGRGKYFWWKMCGISRERHICTSSFIWHWLLMYFFAFSICAICSLKNSVLKVPRNQIVEIVKYTVAENSHPNKTQCLARFLLFSTGDVDSAYIWLFDDVVDFWTWYCCALPVVLVLQ